jgi:hypothetical protein
MSKLNYELLKLPAYHIGDQEIREAIMAADKQGWPMHSRVLLLPAKVGDIYGCRVEFSKDVKVPTLKGTLTTDVWIEVA